MYKKYKIDRIISIVTLVTSVIAVYLVIKRPQPVPPPQSSAAVAANVQSFAQKFEQIDKPRDPEAPPAEVRITSTEATAAFVSAASGIPASAAPLTPNTDLGAMPDIQDKQITFDGDQA